MTAGRHSSWFGTGSMRRDCTDGEDIAIGVRILMACNDSVCRFINVCNSRAVSRVEMVRILKDASGFRVGSDFQSKQPGYVRQTRADAA